MLTELRAEGDGFLNVIDCGERPAKLCDDIHSSGDINKSTHSLDYDQLCHKKSRSRTCHEKTGLIRARMLALANAFTGKILPKLRLQNASTC